MNREIKFRAWDGNRMRDVFKILFTETTGLIVYFTATESGKEPGHLIEQDSRLKLMQYTGLKDKNGKEIYEHDHDGSRVVKFIEDYGGYVLENMETFKTERLTCDTAMFFTIKGNIHENAVLAGQRNHTGGFKFIYDNSELLK